MATNKDDQITQTEQNILNKSQDTDFKVLATEMLGYDPTASTLNRVRVNASGELVTVTNENFQYMGTDSTSSATYKYIAFAKFSGVGFYCMRIHQTNTNDVAYYYDPDGTSADFNTFWADPSDVGFTYINPMNG